PEPLAWTVRSGMRSRFWCASFSSRWKSCIRSGPRGPALRLFWLSATGAPLAVVMVDFDIEPLPVTFLNATLRTVPYQVQLFYLTKLIRKTDCHDHSAPSQIFRGFIPPPPFPPCGGRMLGHAAGAVDADAGIRGPARHRPHRAAQGGRPADGNGPGGGPARARDPRGGARSHGICAYAPGGAVGAAAARHHPLDRALCPAANPARDHRGLPHPVAQHPRDAHGPAPRR